jgi:hypothetical protein
LDEEEEKGMEVDEQAQGQGAGLEGDRLATGIAGQKNRSSGKRNTTAAAATATATGESSSESNNGKRPKT